MITDNIKNCDIYSSVDENLRKAFEFLKGITKETEHGKHVIDENNVWVSISEINPDDSSEKVYEAHKNFIDIHYIVCGNEEFGYSNTDKLVVTKEYNSEKDIYFLKGDINTITLNPGDFVVTYPQDAHIPAMKKITDEKLIRAVSKIRISN